jgi:hypothetical protein
MSSLKIKISSENMRKKANKYTNYSFSLLIMYEPVECVFSRRVSVTNWHL